MKNAVSSKILRFIINVFILFGLLVGGPVLFVIGRTFAASDQSPVIFKLGIGESKILRVGNAYVWTNTDATVLELDSAKVSEVANVTGLKEGTATIAVGTAVGQVLTFTYNVVDKSNGGNNGGNGNDTLKEIPGLNDKTPVDTVLDIGGDKWIVLQNIEMEGSRYAMLLKQTVIGHILFEMSGSHYEGSILQNEFTKAYTDSHIPEVLMNNAVVPKLGDDSKTAVSVPTSKMALAEGISKDIIFPLSYKEAVDWSGSTYNSKLYLDSHRWWMRTPESEKMWHYVITIGDTSPKQGSIITNITEALKAEMLHLRPAIWVKYE